MLIPGDFFRVVTYAKVIYIPTSLAVVLDVPIRFEMSHRQFLIDPVSDTGSFSRSDYAR